MQVNSKQTVELNCEELHRLLCDYFDIPRDAKLSFSTKMKYTDVRDSGTQIVSGVVLEFSRPIVGKFKGTSYSNASQWDDSSRESQRG